MNLNINDSIVTVMGKISKSDLNRIAENKSQVVITLGEDSYWENIFLIQIYHINSDLLFWIAIFTETNIGPSIIPGINNCIVIGFNKKIVFINTNNAKIMSEKDLTGIFFYAKYFDNKLIIITETGILILNEDLNEIFSQFIDVVINFKFIKNLLICKTHSGLFELDLNKV